MLILHLLQLIDMDSDDNCLVIDIDDSTMDMEVTSTTQSRGETPVNGIETTKDMNQQENEANSMQKPYDDGTPRQKERSGDKAKSKDGKNKITSTPTKEKRRSVSKRAHYVRLSPLEFKEKRLNVG